MGSSYCCNKFDDLICYRSECKIDLKDSFLNKPNTIKNNTEVSQNEECFQNNSCLLQINNRNNRNYINIINTNQKEDKYDPQSTTNIKNQPNDEIIEEEKSGDYYTSSHHNSIKLEKKNQPTFSEKKIIQFDKVFKKHSEYISDAIFDKMNLPIINKIEEQLLKNIKKNTITNENLLERPPLKFISNKSVYKGSWNIHSLKKEGYGILFDEHGNKYRGEFKDDKFDGEGLLISINGDYYFGNWEYGLMNGEGIFYSNEKKFSYEGNFLNNKFHGNGKIIYDDKSYIFEGKFVDGVKEGKGKLTFKNGSYYNGDFKKDYYWGEGEFCFHDGRKYIGSWKKNKMNGKGIFIWDNETKYEGEYKNNERNGDGKYYFGKKYYKGKWLNNFPNGQGKICYENDNIVDVVCKNGIIISLHKGKSNIKNDKSPKKKPKSNVKFENIAKPMEIDEIPGIARKVHSKTINVRKSDNSINN